MMNNEKDVAFLLRTGIWANSKDEAGKTPLMTASSRGHVGVVQLLVAHLPKKALEERATKGWTALHFAADRGREEVVGCLLMNGAQASSKDSRGRTPLMHASRRGHLGVVKTLLQMQTFLQMAGENALEERDEKGWTALLFAAAGGHEEVSAFLLSHGAQASSKDHTGMTPLMMASRRGHLGLLKKLVEHVGGQGLGNQDQTPVSAALYYAIDGGNEEAVAGARWLEDRDDEGMTALHGAADGGQEAIVAFLLSHGAQADSKDIEGVTPLMLASRRGHMGVIQRLLQVVGVQGLAERDKHGGTALHYAADEGHADVVVLLLSTGAEANSKDHEGWTPLMTASAEGRMGVVQMILRHSGEKGLDDRMADGRTALHLACWAGLEEITRALVLAGADTTITDHEGTTPRTVAFREEHDELVAVLDWWQAELERPYLIQRAQRMYDLHMNCHKAGVAPMPAFLKARGRAGPALPRLRVVAVPQKQHVNASRTKASADYGGRQESEEERHAVLKFVLTKLNEQLFIELIDGFHAAV